MTPRFRIAPTPSGFLHLGNGVNFVLTAALAEVHRGELSLRIDDLDTARLREDYLRDIEETIAWLLPSTRLLDTRRQSAHLDQYREVLRGLRQNSLVFACCCTRRQIAAVRAQTGIDVNDYPGTCGRLDIDLDDPNTAWRMRDSGVVVRQKDGMPSYQLASLIDDVEASTTHLVRGEDLRESTAIQQVLAKALSAPLSNVSQQWPAFARFAGVKVYHHPLLTGAAGDKLSKSAGAASLKALRASSADSAVVYRTAGDLLGVSGVTDLPSLTYALRQRPVLWT